MNERGARHVSEEWIGRMALVEVFKISVQDEGSSSSLDSTGQKTMANVPLARVDAAGVKTNYKLDKFHCL